MSTDIPLKQIYIVLENGDRPEELHTCGQKVKGTVVCRPSKNLTTLSIRLRGVVRTSVTHSSGNNQSSTTKAKAILFEYSHILSHSLSNSGNGQTQTWPFEFVFPFEAVPAVQSESWREHETFHHLPGHQLPPTWSSARDRQSVSYCLEAIALKPSSLFHSKMKEKVQLFFMPCRYVEHPNHLPLIGVRSFTRSSRKLDPALTKQHYSLKEKARHLLGTSLPSEPRSSFRIHFEIPRVVCANGDLPIVLGIEHDLANSTSREIPVIYLKELHVNLNAYTFVRARSYIRHSREKIVIESECGIETPMYERMNLSSDIGGLTLKIPNHAISVFKTYSIARSYELKVKIVVSCAEKDYKIKLGRQGLEILPSIYRHPANDGAAEEHQAPLYNPVGEYLPPYEVAAINEH